MYILVVLALFGSGLAQFAPPTSGFAAPSNTLIPPVRSAEFAAPSNTFAIPVGSSGFVAPANTFATPVRSTGFAPPASRPTGFAAPVSSFGPPAAGFAPAVPSRVVNFDSSSFVPTANTGFNANNQPAITIVDRTHYLNDNGEFSSSFKASDGQTFEEVGSLRPTNDQLDQVVVKKGSYQYTSPEGVPVSVTYTADEYGFHPVSSSIPQQGPAIQPAFV